MKRKSKYNVQHDEVPQPQEVDLGGLGHGHEGHSSAEVNHAAHQNGQHEEPKYRVSQPKSLSAYNFVNIARKLPWNGGKLGPNCLLP